LAIGLCCRVSVCPALLTSKNDTADKGGNSITPIQYGFYVQKKRAQKYLATKWSFFFERNKMELFERKQEKK
jgi:hypothetical protein